VEKPDETGEGIDWRLTTWEGARREALRRWAALPLEHIIAALEEMEALGKAFSESPALPPDEPRKPKRAHGDTDRPDDSCS
jgi:hypothetical protein